MKYTVVCKTQSIYEYSFCLVRLLCAKKCVYVGIVSIFDKKTTKDYFKWKKYITKLHVGGLC